MSRLLRSLEDEGLVETVPHPDDARRRCVQLTPKGLTEYQAYEALSNAQAEVLLTRHARAADLLSAMDLVASALGRNRITVEEMAPTAEAARYCLSQYYSELAQRFENGFDVSLSRDPEARDMVRPRGVFFVAMSDSLAVGCVGLVGKATEIAEIKRLWVAPAARGLGLARQLMDAAETAARELSIKTLRLDTNSRLTEANKLYLRTGWRLIDRFNNDPYPDTFFEKQL